MRDVQYLLYLYYLDTGKLQFYLAFDKIQYLYDHLFALCMGWHNQPL